MKTKINKNVIWAPPELKKTQTAKKMETATNLGNRIPALRLIMAFPFPM